MKTLAVAIILSCLSAVPVFAQKSSLPDVTVKANWGTGSYGVTGTNSNWKYRYGIITDRKGVMHLCGVGQYKGAEIRQHAKFMQRNSGLYINDKLVAKDIRFFGKVFRFPDAELVGAPAVCKSTGQKRPRGSVTYGLRIDDPRVTSK